MGVECLYLPEALTVMLITTLVVYRVFTTYLLLPQDIMLRYCQTRWGAKLWTHEEFSERLSKALDNDRRDFAGQLKVPQSISLRITAH